MLVPAETGAWFEKLVAVQSRLRAPKGCPWDREQTHQSLRTYLIEEAYEVLDAMESGDDAKFADELGDLLLQVLFHADIAREDGRFDVVDVIRAIHDKMIRTASARFWRWYREEFCRSAAQLGSHQGRRAPRGCASLWTAHYGLHSETRRLVARWRNSEPARDARGISVDA